MARRSFGSVRRLPSGRYQARYQLFDRSWRQAPETFERKRDAERWLSAEHAAMAADTWIDPARGKVTVGEWAAQWLASATSHLKPKTVVGYTSLVRAVLTPTLGARQVGAIRRSDVQMWVTALAARGLSPSRIRQAYRLLSQLMKAAELDGLIHRSPCVGIRLPRIPEHDPKVLTQEQVAALVGAMRPPYDLFTMTLAYTGIRFGEGAGLQRRRVDVSSRVLTVAASLSDANGVLTLQAPKSHQQRMVTMPAFLAERLAEHLDSRPAAGGDELVFTSPEGLPIRHQNFMRRVWYPACEVAGVEATPHALRASHATWLFDTGWSPVEIAGRLGHDKATVTTKHYARRVPGRDAEIAEALDVQLRTLVSESFWHVSGTNSPVSVAHEAGN